MEFIDSILNIKEVYQFRQSIYKELYNDNLLICNKCDKKIEDINEWICVHKKAVKNDEKCLDLHYHVKCHIDIKEVVKNCEECFRLTYHDNILYNIYKPYEINYIIEHYQNIPVNIKDDIYKNISEKVYNLYENIDVKDIKEENIHRKITKKMKEKSEKNIIINNNPDIILKDDINIINITTDICNIKSIKIKENINNRYNTYKELKEKIKEASYGIIDEQFPLSINTYIWGDLVYKCLNKRISLDEISDDIPIVICIINENIDILKKEYKKIIEYIEKKNKIENSKEINIYTIENRIYIKGYNRYIKIIPIKSSLITFFRIYNFLETHKYLYNQNSVITSISGIHHINNCISSVNNCIYNNIYIIQNLFTEIIEEYIKKSHENKITLIIPQKLLKVNNMDNYITRCIKKKEYEYPTFISTIEEMYNIIKRNNISRNIKKNKVINGFIKNISKKWIINIYNYPTPPAYQYNQYNETIKDYELNLKTYINLINY